MPLLDNFEKKLTRKIRGTDLLFYVGPYMGGLVLVIMLMLGAIAMGGARDKGLVLGTTSRGFDNLAAGYELLQNMKFHGSNKEFSKAWENFAQAESILSALSGALSPASVPQLDSGLAVLRAGKSIATAGKYMNASLDSLGRSAD